MWRRTRSSCRGWPAPATYIKEAVLSKPVKFALVGLSGVAVNMGLYALLLSHGTHPAYASATSVEASVLNNFILNELWTFRNRRRGRTSTRLLLFHLSRLAGAAVNIATVATLATLGIDPLASNGLGIVLGVAVNYATSDRVVWRA